MSAPLTLTLLTPSELSVLTLPETCGGQFFLYDHVVKDGKKVRRRLISIEGKNGKWYAKSSKVADVFGESAACKSLEIGNNFNFYIRPKDEMGAEKFIVMCEAATQEKRTFTKYYVEDNSAFMIGRSNSCDIKIDSNLVSSDHAKLNFKHGKWVLRDLHSSNGTYVNLSRVKENDDINLKFGDAIYIMGVTFIVLNGFIALNNPLKMVTTKKALLPLDLHAEQGGEPAKEGADKEPAELKHDYFYRSPRFMREIEPQKIVVEPPPAVQQQNDLPLITTIGPAVTMGMASLFSGVMMAYNTMSSNGSITQALPMLVMSISMMLGMCLWPVITKKYQNSKWLKDERKRQVKYRDYLDSMKEKILKAGQVQGEILSENIIDTKKAAERVFNVSRNLWERTPEHSDFLNLRLGNGTLPIASVVEFPKTPFSLDNDSLLDAIGELKREQRTIRDVPIPFSLTENRIAGIIGERKRILKYVKLLISQLVSLHSYDEVKLVLLTNGEESKDWEYARVLPHIFDNTHQVRFLSENLEEARTLSLFFEKTIAERIEKKETFPDNKPNPYYVVISADRDIALKTEFVERLLKLPDNYGFSLLCLYDELKFLPKECKCVVDVCADLNTATLYDKDDTTGKVTEISLEPNLDEEVEDELFVNVANISLDLASAKFSLPKSISFLDMFEVGKVEHLNVGARWSENSAANSLSTPVGVDQNGEQFMLDLHEKVHGPHGLVAGMTGSGKSEFIITYILSLAVNYNPDEVAFVLIDYKGGGLAGAFDNEKVRLPHLAGTITNLDGAAINRSLVSIESELKRRQAVFNHARDVSNAGTMDIYSYQRLYREGVVSEAVPHLFIISDEFAELKQQQPEFMEQLISTARIGRSLGVHLILATQKPSGVVNDQIWSNSKFKVCLKVQDKADSQEMIKRPEAAELVDTGRFYLQVGYNEYFALGQSAWCGAPYVEQDEYVANKLDERVVAINNLGAEIAQAIPIDKSLTTATKERQIVAIISYICNIAEQKQVSARELWLPPLPAVEFVDDVEDKYNFTPKENECVALIGEIDDPAHQRQLPLLVDISGGILVYGSAGAGKFSFVASLLYSLIKNKKPEEFSAYIIDCAAETLNAFRNAPHVGDVVLAGEVEKVNNLFKLLTTKIKSRKKKFSKFGGGILEYRQESGEICPELLIVIHGLGNFSEMYPDLVEHLISLAREGSKYGVHFLLSANSASEIRYRLSQSFSRSYALHLNDDSDYSSIFGKNQKDVSDVKGRGFCKCGSETLQMQVAYPGNDENNVFANMRKFSRMVGEQYEGFALEPIPVLPEVVDENFLNACEVSSSKFPVGVSKANLRIEAFDFAKSKLSFVFGNDSERVGDFVLGMCNVCASRNFNVCLVNLGEFDEDETLQKIVSLPSVELISDKNSFMELVKRDAEGFDFTFIYNMSDIFQDLSLDEQPIFKEKFSNLKDSKTSYILASSINDLSAIRYEEWLTKPLNDSSAIWIGDGIAEQSVFRYRYSRELNAELPFGFGYVIKKQKCELVKLLSGASEV